MFRTSELGPGDKPLQLSILRGQLFELVQRLLGPRLLVNLCQTQSLAFPVLSELDVCWSVEWESSVWRERALHAYA